jgi:acyl-coenzyme A synthetase/AMP-(fatty) acid ligase
VFIDALPRNATGKVHKPTLRQKLLEPTQALSGTTRSQA